MGKIVCDEGEVDAPDGESLVDAAESLGVPFACTNGACGTCRVEVVEGMENLTDLTEEEQLMGVEGKERLLCQCKIKQGTIRILF